MEWIGLRKEGVRFQASFPLVIHRLEASQAKPHLTSELSGSGWAGGPLRPSFFQVPPFRPSAPSPMDLSCTYRHRGGRTVPQQPAIHSTSPPQHARPYSTRTRTRHTPIITILHKGTGGLHVALEREGPRSIRPCVIELERKEEHT